ncbi:MAG: serine/threonine-protein kinase [Candidatus Omnitrophota bacterium]
MSIFGNFFNKGQQKAQPGRWKVGDNIAIDYKVLMVLGGEGKSGMGVIYVCLYKPHNRIYALKTIQEKYSFSEASQKLFEKEATIWTELDRCPFIVRAHWVIRLEGRLFIALEYIWPDMRGRNTLTHYLGKLSLPEIIKLSIQFCYGMEYAHSRGIDAHRDIKPDNIMVSKHKDIKITDFGLAKVFQEMQFNGDVISQEGKPSLSVFQSKGKNICGTLPYMAPEQFDGYADRRSDVYAFGITLFQMVAGGALPFVGATQLDYEALHKLQPLPFISSPLFAIMQRCVEKNPATRYEDFSCVRADLEKLFLKETGKTFPPPEEKPYTAEELIFKGFALDELGKSAEAVSCYDRAIKIDPNYLGAYWCKGDALLNLGKSSEAISSYDREIEMRTQYVPKALWGKMLALIQLDRHEEALACYDSLFNKAIKKAVGINFNKEDKFIVLANFLSGQNKCNEALKCINEALRLNPNLSEAQKSRDAILQKLGK